MQNHYIVYIFPLDVKQWGSEYTKNNAYKKEVTLPISFSNTEYTVFTVDYRSTILSEADIANKILNKEFYQATYTVSITERTTQSVTIYGNSDGNIGCSFFAIGY